MALHSRMGRERSASNGQRNRLSAPSALRIATDFYLQSEDALGAWMDECCDQYKALWGSSATLFASWREWAERGGEFVGSKKGFGQVLETRGLTPHRGSGGSAGYLGALHQTIGAAQIRRI